MRFQLIDRVEDVQPGKRLRAVKNLTLGEEYLADHFPTFPVMPGVLMLQTLAEASSWLLRVSEDWRHSIITLREVRNVKYGNFMEPGKRMIIETELIEQGADTAQFKGRGECEGQMTVSAKLTLAAYNLADREPALADEDKRLLEHWRAHWNILRLSR